jgi:hypothetical protein
MNDEIDSLLVILVSPLIISSVALIIVADASGLPLNGL